jgi:D-glycero-alpha-D-manno-heptose-7-phosphate kinase
MIITKTPLRISFAGGGTDLPAYYNNGYGAVLSVAINKFIYITLNERFDDTIRLSYSKTEIVDKVDDLQHDIARACLKLTGITKGVEITSIADIPAGTGLGSSSAFTVGLLNALYSYIGERKSAHELGELACKVEIDILKHPIGKQDQFAAAYGGMNYFRFNADESVMREQIEITPAMKKEMDRKLMMFYTGIKRSADGILEKQSQDTTSKLDTLNYMRDQAGALKQYLLAKGFDQQFATTLHNGWLKKKSITKGISSGEIDKIYQAALQAGALGGKILGAGGGGFLLLYCDEAYQPAVRKAVGLRELDFRLYRVGSRVVYFG